MNWGVWLLGLIMMFSLIAIQTTTNFFSEETNTGTKICKTCVTGGNSYLCECENQTEYKKQNTIIFFFIWGVVFLIMVTGGVLGK